MFRRIICTTAAALLAFGPLSAQDNIAADFERYLELWGELVDNLGEASPEACAQGADASRKWADEHLREIIEIEKHLADAGGGEDPLAVLDSTEAERLVDQFSTSFERWMDWGFACIESPEAVAAGEYVKQRRTELELEILGEPRAYSQLEEDLGTLDDPRSQAQQMVADGERLAQSGNIEMALEAFRQSTRIDTTYVITAESLNELCWFGALWERAESVMFACELAVERSGGLAWIIDSRGLARALTGNLEGAIADFETFINSPDATRTDIDDREDWIRALRAGENPLTSEVLEQLRRS
jgi:hypothetical protein